MAGRKQEPDPKDNPAEDPEKDPEEPENNKNNSGPEGDGGENKNGGVKDKSEVEQLKKQLATLGETLNKQQEIITKFQKLGDESPPPKTDAEKIAELQATLEIVSKKLESDAKAKELAEKQKREKLVDELIKSQPVFKDQREMLLKADETILGLLVKQKPNETDEPMSRIGAPNGDDWNKKIAAASERRKKKREALDSMKY